MQRQPEEGFPVQYKAERRYAFEGHFDKGDVVEVYDRHTCIGRGEVLYASDELEKAMGKRTDELENSPIEVIHRNQWVQF